MPSITLTNPTLKKLSDINQNNELEQAAEQNTYLSTVTLEYQESEKGTRIYRQVLRVEIS